jgi:hypothetical protein
MAHIPVRHLHNFMPDFNSFFWRTTALFHSFQYSVLLRLGHCMAAGRLNRGVRYEYDGGVTYVGGDCGLCTHPFHVALNDANTLGQQCVDINGCPACLRRVSNRGASRQLSVRTWELSRHCANIACGQLFRVCGLPRSGM